MHRHVGIFRHAHLHAHDMETCVTAWVCMLQEGKQSMHECMGVHAAGGQTGRSKGACMRQCLAPWKMHGNPGSPTCTAAALLPGMALYSIEKSCFKSRSNVA
eukprot:366399-Chlamydomonas_euryale.AAC.51